MATEEIEKKTREALHKSGSAMYWNIIGIVDTALREQREKYQSLIQLCQELDNLADGLKMPRVLWPILNGIRANLEIIRAFKPGKEDGEDG